MEDLRTPHSIACIDIAVKGEFLSGEGKSAEVGDLTGKIEDVAKTNVEKLAVYGGM
ncbi:MAG: hypothetical protein WED05_11695 [Candidatus Atabeyarchaeum deiterrae]